MNLLTSSLGCHLTSVLSRKMNLIRISNQISLITVITEAYMHRINQEDCKIIIELLCPRQFMINSIRTSYHQGVTLFVKDSSEQCFLLSCIIAISDTIHL